MYLLLNEEFPEGDSCDGVAAVVGGATVATAGLVVIDDVDVGIVVAVNNVAAADVIGVVGDSSVAVVEAAFVGEVVVGIVAVADNADAAGNSFAVVLDTSSGVVGLAVDTVTMGAVNEVDLYWLY